VSLTVAHLIGQFPLLYERALLAEIAAVSREGIGARIVAFHPAPDAVAGEALGLEDRVEYLDVARRYGRVVCGAASLAGGVAAAIFPGSLPRFLRAPPEGTGSRVPAFWRRARLHRILRRLRPDVLHAQFGHLGLFALPVIRSLRIPLVVSFRGQDVSLVRRARADTRASAFAYVARVLVRSGNMRDDLIALGCPAEKVAIQPSGINPAQIPFEERQYPGSDDKVAILIVGRLVPKKGMADALRAITDACPDADGPHVRIAGRGPEQGRLKRMVAELGLANRVRFLGPISHEEVIREMRSAHLFLLACRTGPDGEKEGIPNALKEAMAAGLPVLSTRHAGIAECVSHGRSGLLADEGDVRGIARNLKKLLMQPERWPQMGRAGRAIIESRYDVRKLAPQLAKLYDDLPGK